MRVLWASLVKFPPLCSYLGETPPSHCGWLYSSAKALLNAMPNVKLCVAILSFGRKFETYNVEGITYYLVPTHSLIKSDNRQIEVCRKLIADFNPTIIHIHGTEHSLAEAICRANECSIPTIVSIQGLAGTYSRYADGGLLLRDKLLNVTPLDFYRRTFLLNVKGSFKKRAKCENYVLTHISDVIGRTNWDYSHIMAINPNLRYHFMNETLRDSFYSTPVWSYADCKKNTIFVSNSGSPLKGAHQMLKALPIILREYPDTIVNFCGSSVTSNNIKRCLRFQGYHLFLRRLVKKLKLKNNVRFLGTLTEAQMKQQFLDANVYVMPSAIENSPNSLCEAQILGTPVIASYCGGTPSLLIDGITGYFYRYEEHEMLAQLIIMLFKSGNLEELSRNEMEVANSRHDRIKNANILADIYLKILNGKNE